MPKLIITTDKKSHALAILTYLSEGEEDGDFNFAFNTELVEDDED